MLTEFRFDLHVHTCLSPCADFEMMPRAIVRQARKKKLDGIGICDHNSAENVSSVMKAGKKEDVLVFGGMEVTTSEEVHVLVFFEDFQALLKMQDMVYDNLQGENDEKSFGYQLVMDEHDNIIGKNDRLLIGAVSLGIDEVVKSIHDLGGLTVASHVDRESFGIIGQLGFIPEGLKLDALESSTGDQAVKDRFKIHGLPVFASSDAHFLADIGKACATFRMETASLAEVAMAFGGTKGRSVR